MKKFRKRGRGSRSRRRSRRRGQKSFAKKVNSYTVARGGIRL